MIHSQISTIYLEILDLGCGNYNKLINYKTVILKNSPTVVSFFYFLDLDKSTPFAERSFVM